MNKKIYLAGAMSDISIEEQNNWRQHIENKLSMNFILCNPVKYYNFENKNHKTEKEIMKFDLYKVKNSDIVLVNFKNHKSLGTMAELAIAYEYGIPIIGINADNEDLHPWQIEMTNRLCDSMEEAINHLKYFYS